MTSISRINSSSSCHVTRVGSSSSFTGSGSHLNLHYVHPHPYHNQHVTTRADGTPLLITELETIKEPEQEDQDEDEDQQPLSFQVKV
jgi:hypothetical protein